MSVLRYLPVGPVLALMGLVAVVVAALVLAAPRDRRDDALRLGARVGLGAYLLALVAVTVLGGAGIGGGVNPVPFAGVARELSNVNKELAAANIVGNVLMFVPLPVLVRFALGRSWTRALVVAVCASVLIELWQLGVGRSTDIDDVLLNTTGALVGAAVGRTVESLVRRHRRVRRGSAFPDAARAHALLGGVEASVVPQSAGSVGVTRGAVTAGPCGPATRA